MPIVARQLEILITRFAMAQLASPAIGEDLRAACRLYAIDLSKTIARQKVARRGWARPPSAAAPRLGGG